ncbi:MAG: bifunctional pyr operon transcriptional regulator/uracil phosphoribosyltransferase PyrR [Bacilli bacterium]|nr:bifunctional pyr operon transcriptional regulator/uracil phosphoribosyltransferase PyrR [Bacilli bacterium]
MRELLDYEKMVRTIRRISHEIIERNTNLHNVVFLGIKRNGVPLAKMISKNIEDFENIKMECYELDISGYRDDKKIDTFERLSIDVTNKTVIVVDDVLFTGRTVRASMDAIVDLGRPEKIQLAVLIDRGHRELPIRADYVGKSIPTNFGEKIIVSFSGNKGVFILNKEEI